ncbi:hypothetical protein AgCh_007116 [Apium graveolens]
MESDARAEAERLLTIAAKFLQTKDLTSAHDFAALAQETAPLLDGSDQIIAISDVLLAAETKKVNNKLNWYAILGLDSKSESIEAIKKQYRKLALLLHPDKNNYAFAHDAFRLVADAWAVLSDVSKKRGFDSEYGIFSKVNLGKKVPHQQNYSKGGVSGGGVSGTGTPRRAMHGTEIKTLPPVVEGQEAYYCCWGFFPMGFTGNEDGGSGNGRKEERGPNWVPPVNVENLNEGNGGEEDGNVTPVYRNVSVGGNVTPPHRNVSVTGNVTPVHRNVGVGSGSSTGAKKRGRPRKNV